MPTGKPSRSTVYHKEQNQKVPKFKGTKVFYEEKNKLAYKFYFTSCLKRTEYNKSFADSFIFLVNMNKIH